MKSILSGTLLAIGLALSGAGIAAADPSNPAAMVEHHRAAHGIGQPPTMMPGPMMPRPMMSGPRQGC